MYNPYEHAIVITNRTLVQGSFLEQMEKVVCLHPQGVILRERDLSDEEYEALAEKVLGICAREKVSCFLHSRISIARRLGCTDIHLSIPYVQSIDVYKRQDMDNALQIQLSQQNLLKVRVEVQEETHQGLQWIEWKQGRHSYEGGRTYQIDMEAGLLSFRKHAFAEYHLPEDGPQIRVSHSNYNGDVYKRQPM